MAEGTNNMPLCMCVYAFVYVCVCLCVCMCIYIYICLCVHVCVYVYVYVLYQFLKDNFEKRSSSSIRVIVPPQPEAAIVCGAALFGRNSLFVSNDVFDYTYGISISTIYIQSIHNPDYKFMSKWDNIEMCRSIFSVLVEKNQSYDLSHSVSHTYYPVEPNQTAMSIKVYRSPKTDPKYVTEPGCVELGTVVIDMPLPPNMIHKSDAEKFDRPVEVTLSFESSQLQATVTPKYLPKLQQKPVIEFFNYVQE